VHPSGEKESIASFDEKLLLPGSRIGKAILPVKGMLPSVAVGGTW
jgi:hypothetical protein